jgi:type II secretory pathway component GspD/PulD (secretin)
MRAALSWMSAGLLTVAFFGAAQPSLFGQDPAKPEAKTQLKSKVFRLNHCDPDEIMQILQTLMDANEQPFSANPQAPGAGAPGADGIPSFPYQLAADARTRSVVIRATEKNLRLAADLVAVLDLPEGKPLPEVKSLKTFQLKHANAEELANVLQTLQLEAKIMALGNAKMLVVAGPEAAMKEVADLVKDLDIPTPPDKQRKLLGAPTGAM